MLKLSGFFLFFTFSFFSFSYHFQTGENILYFKQFKTEEDAVKTRAALHGTRWPQSNPKILIVDFATIEDVSLHRAFYF